MRKLFIILFLFTLSKFTYTQQIFEAYEPPPGVSDLLGLSAGSGDFADIDNDSDMDLIISGLETGPINSSPETRLYKNNGSGKFILVDNSNIEHIYGGDMKFADIDNDNDMDLLINGRKHNNNYTTKLYFNDGLGNFTETQNPQLVTVRDGAFDFSDVDNDNDLDLIIIGYDIEISDEVTILYKNDGAGNFTEATTGVDFIAVENGTIDFADIDGDMDIDVLITGEASYLNGVAKMYLNDGTGAFTELSETDAPFVGVWDSMAAFGDVDGDNDMDVFISGYNLNFADESTFLYENIGGGQFQRRDDQTFEPLNEGSTVLFDMDYDGDLDIIVAGWGVGGSYENVQTITYHNDGQGNFEEVTGRRINGVYESTLELADIDNDLDLDLLVMGKKDDERTTWLYLNDSEGLMTKVTDRPFTSGSGGVDFADIDGDNDMDVLLSGLNYLNTKLTKLYTNDDSGFYTELWNTPFLDMYPGDIEFADVDGDNDQDVLVSGYDDNYNTFTTLYFNDGMGIFTEDTENNFVQLDNSDIEFADVDNDNDLDFIITGRLNFDDGVTTLYINNGTGVFTEASSNPFIQVTDSSVEFGDVEGDGDLDVLITGYDESTNPYHFTRLYLNDGLGNFTWEYLPNLTGISYGVGRMADVDGVNGLDILLVGERYQFPNIFLTARLYLRDSIGEYTLAQDTPFISAYDCDAEFSDIDGDNDLDLFISGERYSGDSRAALYINDGAGNFNEIQEDFFTGFDNSRVNFVDIDGDLDNDLFVGGYDNSQLYINNTQMSTSISNPAIAPSIKVFPNPTTGTVDIELGRNYANCLIRIIALDGKQISQHRIDNQENIRLNIEGTSGIYFLEVTSSNRSNTSKVIKY